MAAILVRAAEPGDLPALCQLYFAFHEFHVRGVPKRLQSLGDPNLFDCSYLMTNLAKLLDRTDVAVFVAGSDTEIVGMAEVYLRETKAEVERPPRQYGYLQSLMVAEPYRSRGIGSHLLAAAEGWARQRGAFEMQLETWEFSAGPQEFYEHAGYQTLRRLLVHEL